MCQYFWDKVKKIEIVCKDLQYIYQNGRRSILQFNSHPQQDYGLERDLVMHYCSRWSVNLEEVIWTDLQQWSEASLLLQLNNLIPQPQIIKFSVTASPDPA
uniref:MHC class I antigen n=1 Tax=Plectus sambesii TaxID=2011161 RepID=A0A914XPH6_9BILA